MDLFAPSQSALPRDRELAHKDAIIAEKIDVVAGLKRELGYKEEVITGKGARLKRELEYKDEIIAGKNAQLKLKDEIIAGKNAAIGEKIVAAAAAAARFAELLAEKVRMSCCFFITEQQVLRCF